MELWRRANPGGREGVNFLWPLPPYLSDPLPHTGGVNIRNFLEYLRRGRGERIARWGEAELVRHVNGHYELRGGDPEDRQAAREWISLFLHEAVVLTDHPHRQQLSVP